MPKDAVINDFNPQLMNLYIQVRDNLKELKDKLIQLQTSHNEEQYYKIRDQYCECLRKNELSVDSATI